jgi:hypothetical protein
MGEFILAVVAVAVVGLGGYWLGRASMRDRVESLLDELDTLIDMQVDEIRKQGRHPSLRLVRGDQ